MSTITPPKIGIPTLVIPSDKFKSEKAVYWEIRFRDEQSTTPNILSMPPGIAPPDVGKPIIYTTTPVEHVSGMLSRVTWPVSPQLIPAEVREAYKKLTGDPQEVKAPVTNPVAPATTSAAEGAAPAQKPYKAPDRDRLIVRQVVIKAATEYIETLPDRPQDPRFQVASLAEWMEEWIFRSVE